MNICITPGCGVEITRDTSDLLPGPFRHVVEPPFPHAVNDPGPPPPNYAAQIASLEEAMDQLILDVLMGGM